MSGQHGEPWYCYTGERYTDTDLHGPDGVYLGTVTDRPTGDRVCAAVNAAAGLDQAALAAAASAAGTLDEKLRHLLWAALNGDRWALRGALDRDAELHGDAPPSVCHKCNAACIACVITAAGRSMAAGLRLLAAELERHPGMAVGLGLPAQSGEDTPDG